MTFPRGGGATEAANQPAPTGARRNQNIQVNLVDNQELTESLGRQGARVSPVTEFSAARDNYAIELGGIGRQPQILRAASASGMRGEFYGTHNNNILNARTFFQAGDVKPSRRNQYGFRVGGPMGSDRLSFLLTAEETRESGFVNGNVLVPMPSDRTALAEDPAIRALIQSWLDAYPAEAPNQPEIDPNLLNTNALQGVRNTGGSFRMDWEAAPGRRFSARYSLNDNFIDSFEFVVGQNPNQRLKPQTASLAWEEALSPQTTLRVGVNYVRAKVDVLVPPGSVGQWVHFGRDFEHLGPSWDFPIHRADNSFQYLVAGATSLGRHQFDWGAEVIRTQANEFQADGSRGMMQFGNNYGRSAIDNFRHGAPSRYSLVIGELYRGFRRWDVHGYVNDRFALTPNLTVSLGLRHEFAGKPTEVNNLTEFPYDSDRNNFAPRIGLAWSRAGTAVRAGYGIAYGRIFPATYRVGRLNPPAVVRIDANFPDPSTADGTGPNLLEPLRGLDVSGANARSALNLLHPDLVTPYMQQYALEIEQELPGDFNVTAAYAGSRMWKLIRNTRSNRARRVDGVPTKTSTTNLRRPDSRFLSVGQMRNGARAYFDGAQLRFEKVMGQGFFRGTYTFSKALDTGADFSSTAVGKDEQRAQIEALADIDLKQHSRFDAPHAFTLAYAHRLPRWLGGLTLSGSTILKTARRSTSKPGPTHRRSATRTASGATARRSSISASWERASTIPTRHSVSCAGTPSTRKPGSEKAAATWPGGVPEGRDNELQRRCVARLRAFLRSDQDAAHPDRVDQRVQPPAVRQPELEPHLPVVRTDHQHTERRPGSSRSTFASVFSGVLKTLWGFALRFPTLDRACERNGVLT